MKKNIFLLLFSLFFQIVIFDQEEKNEFELNIEQYILNEYPISKYDQCVKIINAAADFNKIVLILEKVN
jgi:hypothetical protein